MYIGNNYMVSVKFYNDIFKNEYFIDEKSAREYANEAYTNFGGVMIELFVRSRVGYESVKKASQNKLVAISKRVAFLQAAQDEAAKDGITIYNGELEKLKKIIENINAE